MRTVAYLSRSGRLALLILAAATAGARAEPFWCPGNPTALGVARVLEIDPVDGPRYGTFQYPTTLALAPKEVVLTFDDGPDPKRTPEVLAALGRHCVKATFFEVGRWAEAFPEVTKRVVEEGHTLASHSWSHPANLGRLKFDKAKEEIERGFAALRAVSGGYVAPLFRYPGLNDSKDLNDYLAHSGIAVLSCDIGSDDWLLISAKQIVKRTLARLERKGSGILLFHDRRAVTVKALPLLLDELKERGYRVVHIVPKASGVAALK